MCISILPADISHSEACPAKAFSPDQRQKLGVQALAGEIPITELAQQAQVSRKFVHEQMNIAQKALQVAFDSPGQDDQVLFHLPITKAWMKQFTLGQILIGHSSFRGVIELVRDLFDFHMSIGTVHNIVQSVVAKARDYNGSQELSAVRVGLHDELFQSRRPVLAGIDAHSTYCYLLSQEPNRDTDTWGVRLLELCDRGFAPESVVADAGAGLRAGQKAALSNTPCRSDVFHALQEAQHVGTILENKAYRAIGACRDAQHKVFVNDYRPPAILDPLRAQLAKTLEEQQQAVQLADDVASLIGWFRHDVLGWAGPPHAERREMYDFIVAELKARIPNQPSLRKLTVYLANQRDDLLAFAAELDIAFMAMSAGFDVSVELVRELFAIQTLDCKNPIRWSRDAKLRQALGSRYFLLSKAVEGVRCGSVRASSLVENFNGRLRNYFHLRHHLGDDYLALLQFFFNHRRYLRSEHPARVGKSPTELLTGKPHPHWLEMLGFTLFSRN